MFRTRMSVLATVLTAVFLFGCAAKQPAPIFTPVDLDARSGEYVKKVDNVFFILDASGSMNETYQGRPKVDIAVEVVDRISQTMPDMGYISGVRTIGNTISPFSRKTDLIYGMVRHNKADVSAALEDIGWAGGLSPMAGAQGVVDKDLEGLAGKTALIIVSDAKEIDPERPLESVRRLKNEFGDRLCVYTILVGNDSAGRSLMRQLAEAGGCGFAAEADRFSDSAATANYVEDVFLARAAAPSDADRDGVVDANDRCPATPAGVAVDSTGCPLDTDKDGVYDYQDRCPGTPEGVAVNVFGCPIDSDGDGVADYLDRCPDTPRWTEVDAAGCPVDSDGDGVTDDKDRCPGTPAGAAVNEYGCWELSGVLFDTGKSTIKPSMSRELDAVASVMRRNPDLKIEVQGHTDSTGNAAFNQQLSEDRARAVVNYLIGAGISAKRLQAKGLGENRPVATNDTPEGRAQNRRVELKPIP